VGDFEVLSPGPPAHGGVDLTEALNIVGACGLSVGDYRTSATAFFWLNQITDVAAISHLGDSIASLLFGGQRPTLGERTTVEHAQKLWQRMAKGAFFLTKAPAQVNDQHSDAIVAIDRYGNVAALVHTINTDAWGSTGIFVDGVSIPDSAASQQEAIARAGPGNRLPDPMEPLIVLRGGEPVYALASIGAGLHQKTLVTLLNLMAGRDLKSAIDAPAPHLPKYDDIGGKTVQVTEGEFAPYLLQDAEKLGLKIHVFARDAERTAPRGFIVGAAIDSKSGLRRAAVSKTFNAVPLGESSRPGAPH
jgi:gamma-glutamyltranspeptidase/glutathione hydrolase